MTDYWITWLIFLAKTHSLPMVRQRLNPASCLLTEGREDAQLGGASVICRKLSFPFDIIPLFRRSGDLLNVEPHIFLGQKGIEAVFKGASARIGLVVKAKCAMRGTKIADAVRELLLQKYGNL